MNKIILKSALFLAVACMVAGCAAQKPVIQAQDLNPKLADGQLIAKVNSFLVILDGSVSMSDPYKGQTKSCFAKGLVGLMNRTIPDLKLLGGLRTFGTISCWSDDQTALLYGVTPYTKAGLDEAVKKVRTSGVSPLELAITGASEDLKSTSGGIAVIIFSDGEDMDVKPVLAARAMKVLYGDRVCIYTVLTGCSPAGKKLLEDVAREGGCGFFVTGDSIATSRGMADFVEKVFLMRKPAAEEMKAVMAVKEAAPERVALDVQFDTGKAVVKSKYHGEIKKVADFMKANPSVKAVIEGYTDNVGKEASNIKLSQRRADAIQKILVVKYKIAKSRIKAVGYGPKNPIADNKTAEGRQKNRRVEAIFGK